MVTCEEPVVDAEFGVAITIQVASVAATEGQYWEPPVGLVHVRVVAPPPAKKEFPAFELIWNGLGVQPVLWD
jgi:hypothetical protein